MEKQIFPAVFIPCLWALLQRKTPGTCQQTARHGRPPSECQLPPSAQAELHSSPCVPVEQQRSLGRDSRATLGCIFLLESSRCCGQTHGMCMGPDGPELCPYLGGQGEIQECLGVMWAFSSASLKSAPKAVPSVLAQYREKESDALGGREMWPFRGFLSFPCSDPCTFK